MRRIIALLLLSAAFVFVTPAGAAVWGHKARNCAHLAVHLQALELQNAPAARLQSLRTHIADRCVALNEMQVVGSHNSYHIQPRPELLSLLLQISSIFQAWEYTHLPLDQQFETENVRQIELDVYADPFGGHYARRGGLLAVNEDPNSGIPELMQPGFKVLHVQDLDFESNCLTFVQCLRNVKAWSDAHPKHLPIMILVEAEQDTIPDPLNYSFAVPFPFTSALFDDLDAEIRSVFPPSQLITPDRIRRGRATLEESVLMLGWPRLGVLRGKVMFTLDNGGSVRDAYTADHPALRGRILFTDSPPGSPEAAFMKLNDPLPDPTIISDVVSAGYVVRTRTDVDTVQARTGDVSQRDAALASGAQWVSTDYASPNPAFGTGYAVQLGSPARCNPIIAPPGCRSSGLE